MREMETGPALELALGPRLSPALQLFPRGRRVRLSSRSWFDHPVGTAEVLGISLGLAAELEELREREVELVGGLRSLDLRAREPETRIDHVERRRLPFTKRKVLQPDVFLGARDRALQEQEKVCRAVSRSFHALATAVSRRVLVSRIAAPA